MVTVREAGAGDLEDVRKLMRAFIAWHHERHAEDRALVEGYFDRARFERELVELPGDYAAPSGRLLVAEVDGTVAGCVALHDLGAGVCEMKRMFVYPDFHGRGVGLALGRAIVEEARSAGYRLMRLDTGARQEEAKGLYRKLGFREIDAYYDLPGPLRNWLTFMELELG